MTATFPEGDSLQVLQQIEQTRYEGDDEDGGEDEEDEWEDDLDGGFHGLGFDVLAAAFADVVGLVLEGLAHTCAETFGLDDGGHEERDVFEAATVCERAHGGAAHDAHADVFLQAAAFVDEGAFHAGRDLGESCIKGKASLDTDAEQIENLRQLPFDLLLTAVNGGIEKNDGHQAAEDAKQENDHGFLDGCPGAAAHEYGGKEPHDERAEQAAAEELRYAPFAGFAGEYEAFLDDGAQTLWYQMRGQFFHGFRKAARFFC